MHPSQPAPDRFFYFWLALRYFPESTARGRLGENAEHNWCCHTMKQVIIFHPEHFLLSLSQYCSTLIKIKKYTTSTTLFIFLWLRWEHSWWLFFHKIHRILLRHRALTSQRVNLVYRHKPVIGNTKRIREGHSKSIYLCQGHSGVCLLDVRFVWVTTKSSNMAPSCRVGHRCGCVYLSFRT